MNNICIIDDEFDMSLQFYKNDGLYLKSTSYEKVKALVEIFSIDHVEWVQCFIDNKRGVGEEYVLL